MHEHEHQAGQMTATSPNPELGNNPDQLGKYRLVATLGQGGMGTVHLAFALGLGQFRKLLVVKQLREELTRKEGFVSMFMDEARLAARLEHPNVVQTFEVDQEGDRYFLAMQYLDGQPLSVLLDRLRASGGLPLDVHLQILCEVLSGLHYAHELRDFDGSPLHVVHRDISPQNVFITYHGQVKLVDFGVAKAAGSESPSHPGIFKGKFAYAAPEQIVGGPVDGRSDVFSVGIMLWQAIAGRRFSPQLPTPESVRARVRGEEPRVATVMPDVNRILAAICDQALAANPTERFASAQAFRDDLLEYLEVCDARVDATAIGELMRRTFDAERRNTHQLIAQAMKDEDASASLVSSLPFIEAEKVPTSVAELSSLADLRRRIREAKLLRPSRLTPLGVELAGKKTPAATHRSRWLAVAVAAAGALGLGLVSWLGQAPETVATTLPPAAAELDSATPAPVASPLAAPVPVPVHATWKRVAAARPEAEDLEDEENDGLPPDQDSAPAASETIDGESDTHRVLRASRAAPRAPRTTAEDEKPAREEAKAEGPREPRVEVLRAPREQVAAATTSPAHPRERARERSKRGDDRLEMGADLRSMKSARDLPIDVEDPYQ